MRVNETSRVSNKNKNQACDYPCFLLILFSFSINSLTWHRDGPNDSRKSHSNAVVFSTMLHWRGFAFRFTVIMHSRQSCGDWMIKNDKACLMRNMFWNHTKSINCGRLCENFHLSDAMINHKWEKLGWKKYDAITIIFVPEFMNRYSFVSSYAWLINDLSREHKLERHHAIQLLYVALLTPSQIQFHVVVWFLMKSFTAATNLCAECVQHCKKEKLVADGGLQSRFPKAPSNELPLLEDVESNTRKIESAVKSLNDGEMLDQNGLFVNNSMVVHLKGVGSTRALSFPSLCCFTGFGTTDLAIQTAKQAIINSNSMNMCAGDKPNKPSMLGSLLKVEGDSLPCKNSCFGRILEATGMSIGDV